MSTPQQPSFRYPFALNGQPDEVKQAHIFAFNAILDLQNANKVTTNNIKALQNTSSSSSSTTTIETVTVESILAGIGTVNDQTGQTSYTTQSQDAGALLILNDASPVAVSLNSAVSKPFALFIANFGTGLTTLTPTSGTVNGGASLALSQNQSIWCVFDGTDWKTWAFFAPPQTIASVAHEFLTSYASSTGAFTQAQPAFTDVSGTLSTGQLPADVPVVSFGAGAPTGSSTEGYIYFNTSVSPYNGYVFHSGAWQQFS